LYSVAVDQEPPAAVLRIGELSRRLGVSDHVLRAWERRYAILRPVRSPGGFRLYSEADVRRVQRMQAHLGQGLSPAEAARTAIDEERAGASTAEIDGGRRRDRRPTAAGRELAAALDALDEPAAQAVLDELLSTLTIEMVVRDVVLPYLHELGQRWQRGDIGVADEHFASNVIRGRLAGLARGWGHGRGPRALLACMPGELHDIALLAFGVVLNRNGWRISYLGADTPVDDLIRTTQATHPDLVVVTATTSERFEGVVAGLSRLAVLAPLALGGAGATPEIAAAVGAQLLAGDPVTAAERMPVPER
jgi:MerR family transcriptional regulator, light-induced transcriptional regulator